ncbi:hypothetical protein ACFHW2_39545 [Actinomadura sp. LOL_016]|uniref:hypothetical protein n=1 Tax=unclassified Actinomadura TaxID=2626254 RepID=UPI003A7F6DDA
MTARTTGRATLPALLAAASVVALAVPAAAQIAVPAHAEDPAPAPATESVAVAVLTAVDKDCAQTLGLLKEIELLPGQPELAKTLCTLLGAQSASEEAPATPQLTELQMPDDYAPPAAGQPTEANTHAHDVADHKDRLLGLPVKWPAGLTVWIPTLRSGEWHSYSNSAADGAPVR